MENITLSSDKENVCVVKKTLKVTSAKPFSRSRELNRRPLTKENIKAINVISESQRNRRILSWKNSIKDNENATYPCPFLLSHM